MPWAPKPQMFTWEANAKSPTFLATCAAENQIGCVLRPGKWPRPWKASGRSTGALEANLPNVFALGTRPSAGRRPRPRSSSWYWFRFYGHGRWGYGRGGQGWAPD